MAFDQKKWEARHWVLTHNYARAVYGTKPSSVATQRGCYGALLKHSRKFVAPQWTELASTMYVTAGAYDMPERFLDVLLAASEGESWTKAQADALLPVQPQRHLPEDVRRLVEDAVSLVLDSCGNSYANAWTEAHLTTAKKYGVYHGPVTGDIVELQSEWQYYLDQRKEGASDADSQRRTVALDEQE